ncbi:hypothetical protein [Halopseudomonas salegens]|uniref:Sporulation related protein n=1 Tax=Halopseudomonas salegens TaxID=1434072 RepID=A0A1H2H708_9GAMM|nr:hypothetical protein [Halopseudomonas salegens]SDU27661.1 hypothetical protein SAMN05216210_2822 [Halopseudomonas salegens]
MRWVFLSLLLINILYALWQVQQGNLQWDAGRPATPVAQLSERAGTAPENRTDVAAGLCMHLGGLEDGEDLGALRQRLLALGVAARMVALDSVAEEDYLLVKTVPGGRSEVLAALRLLQDSGIESYMIGDGAMAGKIALGVFSSVESARNRREQLQLQGYDSEIEQLERYVTQVWLEVDSEARRLVDANMLQRLRDVFPGLVHHYRPCGSLPPAGV